jgi:hypothetical protein
MSNGFILDTPYHKRWWLPDGRHQYDSQIHGLSLEGKILDGLTGETKLSWTIDMSKEGWVNLSLAAQDLARKKYPAEPKVKHHG